MRSLITFLVIVVVLVAGVGWYLDWFKFNKSDTGHEANFNVTVNKDKVKQDVESARDKAKETTENLRGKIQGSSPTSKDKQN